MNSKLERQFLKLRRFISKPQEKGEPSAGFFPPRIREKAKQLCLNKRANLLEVGCGEGLFLQQLLECCPDLNITGIDSWSEILDEAKNRIAQNKRINILQGEAKDLPFSNEYFSTVVCLNVLYNLPSKEDVEKLIREMGRVCRVGGSIIIDLRNRRNPLLYLGYKWVKCYDPSCPWPLNTYKVEQIEQILDKINFRILRQIAIGFPMRLFAPVILIEAVKEK